MISPEVNFRWRACSDVDREYALFELLKDETILLDVGFSDSGVFEVSFDQGVVGWIVDWEQLQAIIADGKRLALTDL